MSSVLITPSRQTTADSHRPAISPRLLIAAAPQFEPPGLMSIGCPSTQRMALVWKRPNSMPYPTT
jgi:hypothetical protein